MIEEKVDVAFNRALTGDTWLMGLRSASIAGSGSAGQFVMLRVRDGVDPILRRPFSICGIEGNLFLILYRVVGKGTKIMVEEVGAGDRLSVLGPLGKGFRIPEERRDMVLVAGGIGIAPLLFLAQKLGRREYRFMAGYRSAEEIIPVQEVLDLPRRVEVSTDDGTEGYHGPVTGLLEESLERRAEIHPSIFTCGPRPMLKRIAATARKKGLPCEASVEASMACGLGACLGCVVHAAPAEKQPYYHVCSDGPVFPAERIDWEKI